MISSQQLAERIQKNVGVPCQSQRSSQHFGARPTLSPMYGTPPFTTTSSPETSLEELARDMQRKLKTRSMRVVGDPKPRVTKLAHAGHYIQQCMQALPNVDVLIVFECREW